MMAPLSPDAPEPQIAKAGYLNLPYPTPACCAMPPAAIVGVVRLPMLRSRPLRRLVWWSNLL